LAGNFKHSVEVMSHSHNVRSSLSSLSLLGTLSLLVLSLDLLEVGNVLSEVLVLVESDKELSLLLLAVLFSLHGDGLSLNLLELSVVVSTKDTNNQSTIQHNQESFTATI
jgi:hypothetical protein